MAVGRRAPSLHNGQHFHLVIDSDEPDVAIVRFERARGVPVGDSTGRFLFVALGAFLDSIHIALAAVPNGAPPTDDYTLLAMTFVRSQKKAGEISGEWRAVGR